ncbi:hypothetical protein TNCV_1642351 [Trichonephila clavipes]|nr:hypothetical protein TNCV_1642351 [Trichonephila clavipes]
MGIVKKLETYVQHALTKKQCLQRLKTCKSRQEGKFVSQFRVRRSRIVLKRACVSRSFLVPQKTRCIEELMAIKSDEALSSQ